MQWPDLRRAFPWRTGLLMCSIPTLALAALLAWFRGELPPLEGYYLMAYWESSKSAERPENTTQIEWLYKAAPGRQSEPVNRQDVDSKGSGFPPIGLSSSARERGWTQLVKMPVQGWKSFELATFLQEDFYGNRTFREVIVEPLFTICVIPFLVLYVVVIMRQELTAEWRRLYEEVYGDEFAPDWSALWWKFREQIQEGEKRLFAWAKGSLSRPQLKPGEQPLAATNHRPSPAERDMPSRDEKSVAPVAFPAKPRRHMIFPGATAIRNGDALPKPWDKSQWID
jgi:hypothetical protein